MEQKHIYQDNATGDQYIFDGNKLVKIGTAQKPKIGDMGDPDELAKEDAEREKQIEQEREEDGDAFADEYEDEEAKAARLERIKDLLNDDEIGDTVSKESEDKVLASKRDKIKAEKEAERQAKKYDTISGGIEQFSVNINDFIKNEIKRNKVKTWKRPNMSFEGSGMYRKGKGRAEQESIPSIYVYYDQSGSWHESDIAIGNEALAVLNKYVEKGELIIKVFYFANHIHSSDAEARDEGGTGAGAELIEHIRAYKPDNVVVMTDADFDRFGDIFNVSPVKVPGGVWLLFRHGDISKGLVDHLKGKKKTEIFSI